MIKNILLVASLSLAFVACANLPDNYVKIGGKQIVEIQVAKTLEEKMNGLMHRESLDKNEGMLFVWDDVRMREFWMKNTLIPLDILFINQDKKVVNIVSAPPCEADPCPTYSSTVPVAYVLEVNMGWAKRNEVETGDTVEIEIME